MAKQIDNALISVLDAYSYEYDLTIGDTKITIVQDQTFIATVSETQRASMSEIHYHTYYEMFFAVDGELTIKSESDTLVLNDEIICIPPLYKHYSISKGKVYRLLFFFSTNEKPKKRGLFDIISKAFSLKNIISFELDKKVVFYLEEIEAAIAEEKLAKQQRLQSLSLLLFTSILEKIPSTNTLTQAVDNKQVNEMLVIEKIINLNYMDNVTPEMIAEKLHVCTRQVSRIIKQKFNTTLTDMLITKKIDIAKQYLVNTDIKISDIIKTLDFRNENYFYIVFKKKTGLSPLKYRKSKQTDLSPV